MKLFEPRVWSVFDLASLKWASILFGVIVGGFFPDLVHAYVWILVVACLALSVRALVVFFRDARPGGQQPQRPAGAAR